jgi:hypothetical protein
MTAIASCAAIATALIAIAIGTGPTALIAIALAAPRNRIPRADHDPAYRCGPALERIA